MPFKPGQSGNPAGRAIDKPFADALRMELVAAGADHKKLRAIAAALIAKAADGDMAAIKELADRTDGRPAQQIIQSGDPDNPIDFRVSDAAELFTSSIARIAVRTGTPKAN